MGVNARMQVKLRSPLSGDALRKISARLCRVIGSEKFFQSRKEGGGALARYKEYGETGLGAPLLLEVALWGRYYGPGYERGDWMSIISIAEWLEQAIEGAEILYGGDGGEELKPFCAAERAKLKAHAFGRESRDYFENRSSSISRSDKMKLPESLLCELCVPEEYVPQQFGFGGNYAMYSCAVCGEKFQTRDGGETWQQGKDLML